jgi:hypothetical protein
MVKKVHYDNTPNTIRKRQMEARTIGHLWYQIQDDGAWN